MPADIAPVMIETVPDIQKMMSTPPTSDRGARHARFESIFRAHYDGVRRHAIRCGSSDADDVAAECFTALWRKLDEVRPDLERAWLIATTRKLSANQRRGTSRRDALIERIATEPPPTASSISGDDESPAVAALATLSPTDRQVLLLSVWDELTVSEIAFVLDLSRTAAGVRLHRARKRFAAAYSATTPSGPEMDLATLTGGADA
jgi:RNA polymerase sigma-70 factor (ECF subfamily)